MHSPYSSTVHFAVLIMVPWSYRMAVSPIELGYLGIKTWLPVLYNLEI